MQVLNFSIDYDSNSLFFPILGRDPVVIERSNLVNISKLVVKELIEQSLRYGRMLDSDHMPLQHFFIVLEHVLRHGLRPKKVHHSSPFVQKFYYIFVFTRDCSVPRRNYGIFCKWLRNTHRKLKILQRVFEIYLQSGL